MTDSKIQPRMSRKNFDLCANLISQSIGPATELRHPLEGFIALDHSEPHSERAGGLQGLHHLQARITDEESDQSANRVAHSVANMRIGHQETILTMIRHSTEGIQVWCGLAKRGAIDVPAEASMRCIRVRKSAKSRRQ